MILAAVPDFEISAGRTRCTPSIFPSSDSMAAVLSATFEPSASTMIGLWMPPNLSTMRLYAVRSVEAGSEPPGILKAVFMLNIGSATITSTMTLLSTAMIGRLTTKLAPSPKNAALLRGAFDPQVPGEQLLALLLREGAGAHRA